MSHEQKKLDPPPDLIGDSIKLFHFGQMVIHAFAWPFRLLCTRPGTLGRFVYGRDALIGLMFGVPIMMQKPSSRLDWMICKRLWFGLWWLLVIHAVASWLSNRRNRPHRHEILGKPWLGHFWVPCLVDSLHYFFLRPYLSGQGRFSFAVRSHT